MDDISYMKEAYNEALLAFELGEVPIGCIIVYKDKIIGRGHNRRVIEKNVLRHAEIIAISQACDYLKDWRLEDCRLYVTIEPCPMCTGAILQARMYATIYGAKNLKAGCAGSILNLLDNPSFNHQVKVIPGVCGDMCGELMRKFFKRFR